MLPSTRFDQAIKAYNAPIVASIDGSRNNILPNLPYADTQLKAASGVITPSNTAVLSVTAYGDDSYKKTSLFMRSARKFNIPLRWLSFREQWHGFTYHKLQQFLRKAPYLQQQGFEYCFILDAFDVLFTDPLPVLCSKAQRLYEPDTVLFNKELDNWTFPYKDVFFKQAIQEEGCHLNAGALFGSITAIAEVYTKALEIQQEFMYDQPRAGIAEYCMRDRYNFYDNLPRFIVDDQLMLLITAMYYPQLFRTDNNRELLAWTQEHNVPLDQMRARGIKSGQPGQASILHSSVTVHRLSPGHWENWAIENNLVI